MGSRRRGRMPSQTTCPDLTGAFKSLASGDEGSKRTFESNQLYRAVKRWKTSLAKSNTRSRSSGRVASIHPAAPARINLIISNLFKWRPAALPWELETLLKRIGSRSKVALWFARQVHKGIFEMHDKLDCKAATAKLAGVDGSERRPSRRWCDHETANGTHNDVCRGAALHNGNSNEELPQGLDHQRGP